MIESRCLAMKPIICQQRHFLRVSEELQEEFLEKLQGTFPGDWNMEPRRPRMQP